MEEAELKYMKSTHCGYCHQEKPVEESWALPSIAKLMENKGYCNNSSITFHGDGLTLQQYENLMKDGWRRSGGFMYKPDLLRSCCRQYTIRTNYELFVDDGYYNKSTKKNIRRFYKSMETPETPNGSSLYDNYLKKDKKGRFYSVILPNTYSPDKYELFKKYQMNIHGESEDDFDEYSFYNFLCHDPFLKEEKNGVFDWRKVNKEWTSGLYGEELLKLQGPIHECYFIDDKMIAIAVLDILPTTISSVYFIWDPDYAHLGLGTVSAIREISMAKLLQKHHYYMGFYIADCEKMVYKAKFGGEIRNFNRNNKSGESEWVKLIEVGSVLKEGRFSVFEKGVDGSYIDVAEEQYGVEGCLDPDTIASFTVVPRTSIFPTPSIIP
jgi:arginine-tRNA-protein transferase